MHSVLLPLAVAVLLATSGCAPTSSPRAETAADSLALRIAEASGGLDAFAALPVLRFDWAVVRDSAEAVRRRHLWDRAGDRYRVEWPGGEDSLYVALFAPAAFDTTAATGQASLNGTALAGDALAVALRDAYEAILYTDGKGASWDKNPQAYQIRKQKVDSKSTLKLQLAAGGGAAVSIKPTGK